ncbi:hypothetical protein, partial [Streptomyces fradiae]|uniref:hypothetical protein n=1 Tax=Streptomyces fradiae TaxID=1906 RepID=UPI0033EFB402
DKNSTPFTGVLAKDKVWTSLPFVKKGNVHRLRGPRVRAPGSRVSGGRRPPRGRPPRRPR